MSSEVDLTKNPLKGVNLALDSFEDALTCDKSPGELRLSLFSMTDLLDAQASPDHDVHSVIAKHGAYLGITRTENPDGTASFSMPFLTLMEYAVADCILARDFGVIPDLLTLAPEPETRKEKALFEAVQGYLAARNYGQTMAFSRTWEAANLGHLMSRETILYNWLYMEELAPKMTPELAEKWLKRGVEIEQEFKETLEHNMYWAEKRGTFRSKYKKDLLISDSLERIEWRIHDCHINCNYIPVKAFVSLRDKLANMVGAITVRNLTNNKTRPDSNEVALRPFLVRLSNDLQVWVDYQHSRQNIRIVGKSSVGDIFKDTLDPLNESAELHLFFEAINDIIKFERSHDDVLGIVERFMQFDDELCLSQNDEAH